MKKIIKKGFILFTIAYVAYIFISQQNILNSYRSEEEKYKEQIAYEKEEQQELANMRDNINSPEYIEQIAREKLGMYLPNERVYIDIGK